MVEGRFMTMPEEKADYLAKASLLIPPRKDQSELLDEGEGSLDDLRASLNEVWNFNRFFGHLGSLKKFLQAGNRHKALRIADIGTGSGKLALYLQQWAHSQPLELEVVAVDFSERVLSIARENLQNRPDIHLVQADGLNLPFAPNCIDFYISSLFLHHFSPEELIELLGNAYEKASGGIIMSDIVRGHLPLAAFRLIQPIFARHYLTQHDGAVSVQRAYIPEELKAIARAAGIKKATIYQQFPWRMSLVAYKQHG
jgi:SAM-dependent methyltransferase